MNVYKKRENSTADENHGSIRGDIDVFHASVFFHLSRDSLTDNFEQVIIRRPHSHLIPERDFLSVEQTYLINKIIRINGVSDKELITNFYLTVSSQSQTVTCCAEMI